MRKKLTRVGNSQALLLSREVLGLLDIAEEDDVEVQILGNVMLVSSAGLDDGERRAALAFASSLKEDEEVYRRLA